MPQFVVPEQTISLQSPLLMILNGILAFFSPCIIPMIPIYASYLIGSTDADGTVNKATIIRLLGLVLGFIIVFSILGAIGGLAGSITKEGQNIRTILNIISSILLIVFGFMMLGFIPGLNLFSVSGDSAKLAKGGFVQNMLFGAVLVLSWAPCLTPTLGVALTAAASSSSANVLKGIYMLIFYSLGLSIPFVLIILLYKKLGTLLNVIKKNILLIRRIGGLLMIVIGIYNLLNIFFIR